MIRFSFAAKDKEGKKVSGDVEAQNSPDAAKLLRERGLIVLSISEKRPTVIEIWRRVSSRVTFNDISVFTRQFATMIEAGLPITDALVIIRSQSSPSMNEVVTQVLGDVEGGSSLASALEKHKAVFSPVYIALVRAGEEGGVLDNVLNRLADNLEAERDFRGKVRGALIYPVIVVVGMVIVAGIMTLFVIPRLTPFFSELGTDLPLPTKLLIGISDFAKNFWWFLFILFGAAFWGLTTFAKTPFGRTKIDEWKLKLPVIGPLQKKIILTELSRTLGLLVGAGVSILDALKVVAGVVGNSIIAQSINRAAVEVEKGFPLAYTFGQTPDIFPPMLIQMLSVGEETGKLDDTLLKVSKVFQQESDQEVRNLTTTIGPLIMVFLAVGVGFLAIAVFLPIYQLPQAVGG